MNPGLLPRLADARAHEWRLAAVAARPAGVEVPRGRALVRPVGHLLIRVGRRLVGPEPEHRPGLAVHHPRWSR